MKKTFFKGFTIIELMLTLGILTTLFAVIAISLSYVDQRTASDTKVTVIVTELRSQQIRAMTGESGSSGTTAGQGIYFEQNRYTIFRGSTYSSSNTTNYVVTLPSNLEFSAISLPGNQIIFAGASGEVSNYDSVNNAITLRNKTNNETARIIINKLGTVTSIN